MTKNLRGADIVANSLARLGCERIFTLSGNHIMSIFDAVLETKIHLSTFDTKLPPCTWPMAGDG